MPALADNNEAGFWESAEIYRLNEDILQSTQSTWDDWRQVDLGQLDPAEKQELESRALELLREDFADSSIFVLKDPRFCRLLPFWLDVLKAFGARPCAVIPVRNPLEVASSLLKRDGFSVSKSLAVWLRHVLDVELETRGIPRVFVAFDEVLSDPRASMEQISSDLRVSWPVPYPVAEAEIRQFLQSSLKHHRASPEELTLRPEVSDWVRSAYQSLLALCGGGEEKRAIMRIAKLRAELERAEHTLGGLVHAEELARRASESELQLRIDRNLALEGSVSDLSSHVGNLEAALGERQERIDELHEVVRDRDSQITALESAGSDWRAHAENLQTAVDERQARLAELQAHAKSLEGVVADRQARTEELETALSESDGRVAELQTRLDRRDKENTDLRALTNELSAGLETSRARADELEARLGEASARTEGLLAELGRQRASIRDLEGRIFLERSASERLRVQRTRLAQRLNALQTSASWPVANGLFGFEKRAPRLVRGMFAAPKLAWWALTLRLPTRLKLSRRAGMLVDSGLFDPGWYIENNPEVVAEGANPVFHWLLSGCKEGRDPCSLFDTDWYVKENPDAVGRGDDPLSHYLGIGTAAGRDPNPLFDTDWYLSRYPEVAASGMNPLAHYMSSGAWEGYDPDPLFDSDWYLSRNPDIASGGVNPLAHYLRAGAAEGRDPNPFFDTDWYLEQNPDVANGGLNALVHYLHWGGAERRDPSPNFDTALYLSEHPEVAAAGINPLVHFLSRQNGASVAGSSPPGGPGHSRRLPDRRNPSSGGSSPARPSASPRFGSRLAQLKFSVGQAYSLYGGAWGILRKTGEAYRLGGLSRLLTRIARFSQAQQALFRDEAEGSASSAAAARRPREIGGAGSSPLLRYLSLPGYWPSQQAIEAPQAFSPHVTVVVPNFNHARFLRQRLDSVYNQTYRNFSVLLLDDCSTDSSREILDEYAGKFADKSRARYNDENSGSVFLQWKRGIDEARSDLVWIAESDDYCDPDFLEILVPFFADPSVRFAYARSTFVDEAGAETGFRFEHYLDELSTEKWSRDYVETAHREVAAALGRKNTIPNVSSAVFRKIDLAPVLGRSDWVRMRICGDWIFYLNLIRGGKIAYAGGTRNYYRFHTKNTSSATYRTEAYFREHEAVACEIRRLYDVPDETLEAHRAFTERFFEQNGDELRRSGTRFEDLYDTKRIEAAQKERKPNVLMACFAFSTGGGEVFPIRLANSLHEHGYPVTVFDFRGTASNPEVRENLRSDIPVIERTHRLPPLDGLLRDFGVEVVHSHHASADQFFAANRNKNSAVAQIVTMHGMYEAMESDIFDSTLVSMRGNVDAWAYIADKNLAPFRERGLYQKGTFFKVPNGMAPPKIHPLERASFGIAADAFVLCLASRAMAEKGWREAAAVTELARSISGADVQLLLLGDGPLYDEMRSETVPPYVHLLGFVKSPVDYFAMADAGILPTVFKGESFPLTVIECLMAGRPMIASDVGEVRNMLTASDGTIAGCLIDVRSGSVPVKDTARQIAEMIGDRPAYERMCSATLELRAKFDMSNVVASYSEIYVKARRHRSQGIPKSGT